MSKLDELGLSDDYEEENTGLGQFISKPIQRQFQPFGGPPKSQQPQNQVSHVQNQFPEEQPQYVSPLDDLDVYDQYKTNYSAISKESSNFDQISSRWNSLYDDYHEKELRPFYDNLGLFDEIQDKASGDEYVSSIDKEYKRLSKLADSEDGWFGASDDKLKAQEALKQFESWNGKNGLREKFFKLKQERDNRKLMSDQMSSAKIAMLEQMTSIPLDQRMAMDAALKNRGKGEKNPEKVNKLLDSMQWEDPVVDFNTGEIVNLHKVDPRRKSPTVTDFNTGKNAGQAAQDKRRQQAFSGDIETIMSERASMERRRSMQNRGFMVGHTGTSPRGMSNDFIDILDADKLKDAGFTEFKGLPIEEAIAQLGGPEKLEAAKVMKSALQAKEIFRNAQLELLKDIGGANEHTDQLKLKVDKARENWHGALKVAGDFGLSSKLYEQMSSGEDQVGFWEGIVNEWNRGLKQADMAELSLEFATGQAEESDIQTLIDISQDIEDIPTSSALKRISSGKSTNLMEAVGLIFGNAEALPELIAGVTSAYFPTMVHTFMNYTGPAALGHGAIQKMRGKGGLFGTIGLGARLNAGVASAALEYNGKLMEEMHKLGVDVHDPKIFMAAWQSPQIRKELQNTSLAKSFGVGLMDSVGGLVAGRIGQTTRYLGMKGGKHVDATRWARKHGRSDWQQAGIDMPVFSSWQRFKSSIAPETAAQMGFGMSGEALGQYLAMKPGESFDHDAIAAEGALELVSPFGIFGAMNQAWRGGKREAARKDFSQATPTYSNVQPMMIDGQQVGFQGTVTRAGLTQEFRQYDSADNAAADMIQAAGINFDPANPNSPENRQAQVIQDFMFRFQEMNPEKFKELRWVVAARAPDSVDSEGFFEHYNDPSFGGSTVFLNADKMKENPIRGLFHEGAHWARMTIFEDVEGLMTVYKSLTPEQQLNSFAEYHLKIPNAKFGALNDGQKTEVLRRFQDTSPRIQAEEWFALQFARNLAGNPSDRTVAQPVKKFMKKFVYPLLEGKMGSVDNAGAFAAQVDSLILNAMGWGPTGVRMGDTLQDQDWSADGVRGAALPEGMERMSEEEGIKWLWEKIQASNDPSGLVETIEALIGKKFPTPEVTAFTKADDEPIGKKAAKKFSDPKKAKKWSKEKVDLLTEMYEDAPGDVDSMLTAQGKTKSGRDVPRTGAQVRADEIADKEREVLGQDFFDPQKASDRKFAIEALKNIEELITDPAKFNKALKTARNKLVNQRLEELGIDVKGVSPEDWDSVVSQISWMEVLREISQFDKLLSYGRGGRSQWGLDLIDNLIDSTRMPNWEDVEGALRKGKSDLDKTQDMLRQEVVSAMDELQALEKSIVKMKKPYESRSRKTGGGKKRWVFSPLDPTKDYKKMVNLSKRNDPMKGAITTKEKFKKWLADNKGKKPGVTMKNWEDATANSLVRKGRNDKKGMGSLVYVPGKGFFLKYKSSSQSKETKKGSTINAVDKSAIHRGMITAIQEQIKLQKGAAKELEVAEEQYFENMDNDPSFNFLRMQRDFFQKRGHNGNFIQSFFNAILLSEGVVVKIGDKTYGKKGRRMRVHELLNLLRDAESLEESQKKRIVDTFTGEATDPLEQDQYDQRAKFNQRVSELLIPKKSNSKKDGRKKKYSAPTQDFTTYGSQVKKWALFAKNMREDLKTTQPDLVDKGDNTEFSDELSRRIARTMRQPSGYMEFMDAEAKTQRQKALIRHIEMLQEAEMLFAPENYGVDWKNVRVMHAIYADSYIKEAGVLKPLTLGDLAIHSPERWGGPLQLFDKKGRPKKYPKSDKKIVIQNGQHLLGGRLAEDAKKDAKSFYDQFDPKKVKTDKRKGTKDPNEYHGFFGMTPRQYKLYLAAAQASMHSPLTGRSVKTDDRKRGEKVQGAPDEGTNLLQILAKMVWDKNKESLDGNAETRSRRARMSTAMNYTPEDYLLAEIANTASFTGMDLDKKQLTMQWLQHNKVRELGRLISEAKAKTWKNKAAFRARMRDLEKLIRYNLHTEPYDPHRLSESFETLDIKPKSKASLRRLYRQYQKTFLEDSIPYEGFVPQSPYRDPPPAERDDETGALKNPYEGESVAGTNTPDARGGKKPLSYSQWVKKYERSRIAKIDFLKKKHADQKARWEDSNKTGGDKSKKVDYTGRLKYADVGGDASAPDTSKTGVKNISDALNLYSEKEIEAAAKSVRNYVTQALKDKGITDLSTTLKSETWALWGIGKQIYLSNNPEKSSKKYNLANPMVDTGALKQVGDIMVGWELADKKDQPSSALRDLGASQSTVAPPKLPKIAKSTKAEEFPSLLKWLNKKDKNGNYINRVRLREGFTETTGASEAEKPDPDRLPGGGLWQQVDDKGEDAGTLKEYGYWHWKMDAIDEILNQWGDEVGPYGGWQEKAGEAYKNTREVLAQAHGEQADIEFVDDLIEKKFIQEHGKLPRYDYEAWAKFEGKHKSLYKGLSRQSPELAKLQRDRGIVLNRDDLTNSMKKSIVDEFDKRIRTEREKIRKTAVEKRADIFQMYRDWYMEYIGKDANVELAETMLDTLERNFVEQVPEFYSNGEVSYSPQFSWSVGARSREDKKSNYPRVFRKSNYEFVELDESFDNPDFKVKAQSGVHGEFKRENLDKAYNILSLYKAQADKVFGPLEKVGQIAKDEFGGEFKIPDRIRDDQGRFVKWNDTYQGREALSATFALQSAAEGEKISFKGHNSDGDPVKIDAVFRQGFWEYEEEGRGQLSSRPGVKEFMEITRIEPDQKTRDAQADQKAINAIKKTSRKRLVEMGEDTDSSTEKVGRRFELYNRPSLQDQAISAWLAEQEKKGRDRQISESSDNHYTATRLAEQIFKHGVKSFGFFADSESRGVREVGGQQFSPYIIQRILHPLLERMYKDLNIDLDAETGNSTEEFPETYGDLLSRLDRLSRFRAQVDTESAMTEPPMLEPQELIVNDDGEKHELIRQWFEENDIQPGTTGRTYAMEDRKTVKASEETLADGTVVKSKERVENDQEIDMENLAESGVVVLFKSSKEGSQRFKNMVQLTEDDKDRVVLTVDISSKDFDIAKTVRRKGGILDQLGRGRSFDPGKVFIFADTTAESSDAKITSVLDYLFLGDLPEVESPKSGGKSRTGNTVDVNFKKKKNRDLSAFYQLERPIEHEGRKFYSVEAAYQAHKNPAKIKEDEGWPDFFTDDDLTGKDAQKFAKSQKVKADKEVSEDLMRTLLRKRFDTDPTFKQKLATIRGPITHSVKDPFWSKTYAALLEELVDEASKQAWFDDSNLWGDTDTSEHYIWQKNIREAVEPILTAAFNGRRIDIYNEKKDQSIMSRDPGVYQSEADRDLFKEKLRQDAGPSEPQEEVGGGETQEAADDDDTGTKAKGRVEDTPEGATPDPDYARKQSEQTGPPPSGEKAAQLSEQIEKSLNFGRALRDILDDISEGPVSNWTDADLFGWALSENYHARQDGFGSVAQGGLISELEKFGAPPAPLSKNFGVEIGKWTDQLEQSDNNMVQIFWNMLQDLWGRGREDGKPVSYDKWKRDTNKEINRRIYPLPTLKGLSADFQAGSQLHVSGKYESNKTQYLKDFDWAKEEWFEYDEKKFVRKLLTKYRATRKWNKSQPFRDSIKELLKGILKANDISLFNNLDDFDPENAPNLLRGPALYLSRDLELKDRGTDSDFKSWDDLLESILKSKIIENTKPKAKAKIDNFNARKKIEKGQPDDIQLGSQLVDDGADNHRKAGFFATMFSKDNWKELYQETKRGSTQAWGQGSKMDVFIIDYVDKFHPLKKMFYEVKDIVGPMMEKNTPLYDALNSWGKVHQYLGLGHSELEQHQIKYHHPMMEAIRDAGTTVEVVGQYLLARMAPSRNHHHILQVKDALKDVNNIKDKKKREARRKELTERLKNKSLSGIPDDAAIDIVKKLESGQAVGDLTKEQAQAFVRFMNHKNNPLQLFYEQQLEDLTNRATMELIDVEQVSRMESAASYFDWQKAGSKFKFKGKDGKLTNYSYAPMQGFEGEFESIVDAEKAWELLGQGTKSSGKGFDQPKTALLAKGAFGRYKDENGDPIKPPDATQVLGTSEQQYVDGSIRGNKNHVANAYGQLHDMMRRVAFGKEEDYDTPDSFEGVDLDKLHKDENIREKMEKEYNSIFKTHVQTVDKVEYDWEDVDPVGRWKMVTKKINTSFANDPHVFVYRKNGKPVYLSFQENGKGKMMAAALKNMRYESLPEIMGQINGITKFMSQMATSRNPGFIIPNFLRDFGSAFINLTEDDKRELVGDALNLKNIHKFGKAAFEAELSLKKDKKSPVNAAGFKGGDKALAQKIMDEGDAVKMYMFAKANGAMVGYFNTKSVPELIKKMRKESENPSKAPKRMWESTIAYMDAMNAYAEQSIRISSFWAAIKNGRSTQEAALIARRVTVDFNQGGNKANAINSLYMFFRASIAGIDRSFRAIKNRSWKDRIILVGGIMSASYAWATVSRLLDDDEDEDTEPVYDQVSSYVRHRKLIIPVPSWMLKAVGMKDDGFNIRLDLPLGMPASIWGVGQQLADMTAYYTPGMRGGHGIFESAGNFRGSLQDMANPMGGVGLTELVPSPIKPWVEVMANRDYMGKEIVYPNTPWGDPEPAHMRDPKKTPAFWTEVSKQINKWGGGTDDSYGSVRGLLGQNPLEFSEEEDWKWNWSGNQIRHILFGYTIGVAQTLEGGILSAAGGVDNFNFAQVPVAQRFLRNSTYGGRTRAKVNNLRDAVFQAENVVENAPTEVRAQERKRQQKLLQFLPDVKQIDRVKQKYRDQKQKVRDSKMSDVEKAHRIANLDAKELELMTKVINRAQKAGLAI